MKEEDLIIKYLTYTIDVCAMDILTTDMLFSDEYSKTLDTVARVLATKYPHELKKVEKLSQLREKIKKGKKLTFDQKEFIRENMKLVQFLELEDLATAAGKSFYNENGYIKY